MKVDAFRNGSPGDEPVLVSPVPAETRARDVFVYFDNDVKVHAPFDAASLMRRLGQPRTPGLKRARRSEVPSEEGRSSWASVRRPRVAR
jgi:hypothetical protein